MAFLLSDSLMCADLLHLGDQLPLLDDAMDWHHADVMDGHYCPNLTLSPDLVRAICREVKKPVDVHLMVTDPGAWIKTFAQAGAGMLTVHAEVINPCAFRLIREIRAQSCKVGIALNPATPLSAIEYYADEIDCLTLMTVDVGYAGQPMIPQVLKKIRQAADLRRELGGHYLIQVDGCCNKNTYALYRDAGAQMLVMGSGLFKLSPSLETSLLIMREQQAQVWSD